MQGIVSRKQGEYAGGASGDCQRHVMTLQKPATPRFLQKPEIVYKTMTGP